jgi:hypothetical protein
METGKRLIPYSVHLSEDVYLALKSHAQDRKASSMVRDAITMILDGDDAFNSGYNKALRDAMRVIQDDKFLSSLSCDNIPVLENVVFELTDMIVIKKK